VELSKKAKNELQEIISRDYGVWISDDEINQLGISLLRLSRLALAALARADEDTRLFRQERDSLEPQTIA
jgi:hypothetical protein